MNTKLEAVYKAIPKSTCPPNCGQCCGPVFPSMAELRNIKEWCGVHHVEYRDFLGITEEGLCPYLGQMRECIIYAVRPFLCRILGVSMYLDCPIGNCVAMKKLNCAQSDSLYVAIYLHGKEKPRTERHRRIVLEVVKRVAPELLQQREA